MNENMVEQKTLNNAIAALHQRKYAVKELADLSKKVLDKLNGIEESPNLKEALKEAKSSPSIVDKFYSISKDMVSPIDTIGGNLTEILELIGQ